MNRKLLLGFVVLYGLAFTFLVPPFQKPDENRHFYEAQALSDLVVTCRVDSQLGTYLPVRESAYNFPSLLKFDEIAHTQDVKFFLSQFGLYRHSTKENIVKATDWCSWSFIGYIPASIGIAIGRMTGSLMIEFYLARLVSFVMFLAAFIYGLKITHPKHVKWLWFFALLPMTLHQASAISYDSVLLAMIPIIFGYISQFIENSKGSPSKKTIFIYLLSLIIFVLAKPAMIIFYLLILLIPKQKISFLCFLIIGSTLLTIPFLRPSIYRDLPSGVDAKLQTQVIRKDPLYFVHTLTNSLVIEMQPNLEGVVGRFGWLDYQFDYLVYIVYVLLFGFLVSSNNTSVIEHKKTWSSWVIFTTIILSLVTIYCAMYITWSHVGSPLIGGVQGRYLLPLVPFTGLLISTFIVSLRRSRTLQSIFIIVFGLWLFYQIGNGIYRRYYDYSHYGVNDLEKSSVDSSISKLESKIYILKIPSEQGKVVGFYFYPATTSPMDNTYRYEIFSGDCIHSYRIGYIDLYGRKEGAVITSSIKPLTITGGVICLKLDALKDNPANLVDALSFKDGDIIRPLYLIPSLH